jgi:hypothetical protein
MMKSHATPFQQFSISFLLKPQYYCIIVVGRNAGETAMDGNKDRSSTFVYGPMKGSR